MNKDEKKEYNRIYRIKHKDKINANKRRYRFLDLEGTRKYDRDYYHNNKNIIKNIILKKSYGITLKDYEEMMNDQDGKCWICGGDNGKRKLCVDHNHFTGKVRGLLCNSCNSMIGHSHENIERLRKGIEYLIEYGGDV